MIASDPVLYLVCLLIVAIAATVQGTIGMGFGQLSASGLIWTIPELIPAVVILMAMLVGTFGAIREYRHIDTNQLGWAMGGRIVGTLFAIPLLFWVSGSAEDFVLLFATLILAGVFCSLFHIHPPMGKSSLIGGGLFSGLMGTITSLGAPPMAIVFQKEAAATARPTLNAFFAIASVPSLIALAYSGHFGLVHVQTAAFLFPGFLFGVWVSKYLHRYSDARFGFLVLGFTGLSATALLVRALI